jgi:negative regulator of genetic competence, sporulation and motility
MDSNQNTINHARMEQIAEDTMGELNKPNTLSEEGMITLRAEQDTDVSHQRAQISSSPNPQADAITEFGDMIDKIADASNEKLDKIVEFFNESATDTDTAQLLTRTFITSIK